MEDNKNLFLTKIKKYILSLEATLNQCINLPTSVYYV